MNGVKNKIKIVYYFYVFTSCVTDCFLKMSAVNVLIVKCVFYLILNTYNLMYKIQEVHGP